MINTIANILWLEIVHPCTTTLAITWMEIGIINSQEVTIRIKHIVSRYLWVVHLNVLVEFEGQTI